MPMRSFPNWTLNDTIGMEFTATRWMCSSYSVEGSYSRLFHVYATAELHAGIVDDFHHVCAPLYAVGVLTCEELDGVVVPDSDVLLAMIPKGFSQAGRSGPTIIWWRDKFWIPFRVTRPSKFEIAETLWGNEVNAGHFDILHGIEATGLEDIDLSEYFG